MLIDIFGQNHNVTFNSYIASKIGLNPAIYLSELLKEYSDAQNNNSMVENYFILDRSKIFARTTLDEQTQQSIDILFVKLNIMLKRASQVDPLSEEVYINMPNLINTLASDDKDVVKDLNKLSKPKVMSKMSQRDRYKLDLKNSLKCDKPELLQAYRDWIEGVYANPNGFLSQRSIQLFQEAIENYAKDNLDLSIKIVDIATINGYRDAQWAINSFEKNYKKQFDAEQDIKYNKSIRAVQLSNEVF